MYVLTFEEFDVEAGDSLTVFDGRSSAAPLLGQFSGAELPPTLTSTGPNLYLEFTSNDNVKRPAICVAQFGSFIYNLACHDLQGQAPGFRAA